MPLSVSGVKHLTGKQSHDSLFIQEIDDYSHRNDVKLADEPATC